MFDHDAKPGLLLKAVFLCVQCAMIRVFFCTGSIPNFKKFLSLHISEQSLPGEARTSHILKNFRLIERPKE